MLSAQHAISAKWSSGLRETIGKRECGSGRLPIPYGQKIELDQRTFSVHGLPIWSIAAWKGFRTFKEFRYLCPKIGIVAGIR
jgi:hypothetical protein